MSLKPWWEEWDGLLSKQLQDLESAGIKYSIGEKDSQKGILVLDIKYPYQGKELELEVIFPDFFPYFRFEVRGLNFDLPRHQNPFQKNLCLIGRSTLNWNTKDSLAEFILNRLPKVIQAGVSTEPLPEIEEIQGEPITNFYPYLQKFIVLVDSSWDLDPKIQKGGIKLGVSGHVLAVLEVIDSKGEVLKKADDSLSRLFKHHINGRWVRCPEAIKEGEPSEFKRKLYEVHTPPKHSDFQDTKGLLASPGVEIFVTGIIFPEEFADRETHDGWVFLLQTREKINRNGFRFPIIKENEFFLRPGMAGKEDMYDRIPELKSLKDKKIAVFGLGCLGGPSAIEFARCGAGELRIMDFDIVEPGTVVRWPLGIQSSGVRKTDAIKTFVDISYPYTTVIPQNMRLGEAGESQRNILEKFIEGVDLIYDATAEHGVQYFLSSVALKKGIPYICISTTFGAWGGTLARVLPGKTGCWWCLKKSQTQYSIDKNGIPVPNEKENGIVQPKGCADPTFTGASFDGTYIALAGIRLAVSTLTGGDASGYPKFDWDVGIINLRDEYGHAITPEWKTFQLGKYSDCPICSNPV